MIKNKNILIDIESNIKDVISKLENFQFKVLKTDSLRLHLLEVKRIKTIVEAPLETSNS